MNVFTYILQTPSLNSKLTLSVLLLIIPLGLVSSIHSAIIPLILKTEADFPGTTQLFLHATFISESYKQTHSPLPRFVFFLRCAKASAQKSLFP